MTLAVFTLYALLLTLCKIAQVVKIAECAPYSPITLLTINPLFAGGEVAENGAIKQGQYAATTDTATVGESFCLLIQLYSALPRF